MAELGQECGFPFVEVEQRTHSGDEIVSNYKLRQSVTHLIG